MALVCSYTIKFRLNLDRVQIISKLPTRWQNSGQKNSFTGVKAPTHWLKVRIIIDIIINTISTIILY